MAKAPSTAPAEGKCLAGCGQNEKRMGFCPEHFEHYKFGLIRKTGHKALDYDKKLQHFLAHQAARKVSRVA